MTRTQGGARSRATHKPRRTAMAEAFAQAATAPKTPPLASDAAQPARPAKPKRAAKGEE